MSEQSQTEPIMPPDTESKLGGISVRAIGMCLVVITVCTMSALGMTIKEPLYSLVLVMVGWYYGQKRTN